MHTVLNAALPVFGLMLLGYLAGRSGRVRTVGNRHAQPLRLLFRAAGVDFYRHGEGRAGSAAPAELSCDLRRRRRRDLHRWAICISRGSGQADARCAHRRLQRRLQQCRLHGRAVVPSGFRPRWYRAGGHVGAADGVRAVSARHHSRRTGAEGRREIWGRRCGRCSFRSFDNPLFIAPIAGITASVMGLDVPSAARTVCATSWQCGGADGALLYRPVARADETRKERLRCDWPA